MHTLSHAYNTDKFAFPFVVRATFVIPWFTLEALHPVFRYGIYEHFAVFWTRRDLVLRYRLQMLHISSCPFYCCTILSHPPPPNTSRLDKLPEHVAAYSRHWEVLRVRT